MSSTNHKRTLLQRLSHLQDGDNDDRRHLTKKDQDKLNHKNQLLFMGEVIKGQQDPSEHAVYCGLFIARILPEHYTLPGYYLDTFTKRKDLYLKAKQQSYTNTSLQTRYCVLIYNEFLSFYKGRTKLFEALLRSIN